MNKQARAEKPVKVEVVFVLNVIAPYKSLLCNALKKTTSLSFKVIFLAKTAANREWSIDINALEYPYELLSSGRIEDANTLGLSFLLYRRLAAINPPVVVLGGYSHLAFWSGWAWTKINQSKLIVINESQYVDRKRLWLKEMVKKLFVSRCDAALVDGERHKDYAVSLGLAPGKVFIKNGTGPIDVDWFHANARRVRKRKASLCEEMGLPQRNFLFVGRFSPEKNLMLLLRVYRYLKSNEGSQWGLILVGNGPERARIDQYVKDCGLKDVFLPGFKENEELCLFYGLADVFVLPSLSEPWGLVVNEALASGLPVIVSNRCGCVPELVRERLNGFTFDPLKESELEKYMGMFVRDEVDIDLGQKSSRTLLKAYNASNIADVYYQAVHYVQTNRIR